MPLCGLSLYLWGQALAGACGRRLEGRHLVYVVTYIHTEGVRSRPANGGGGIQGRRMHCMRRNTPISIPNVALRGIANSPGGPSIRPPRPTVATHLSEDSRDSKMRRPRGARWIFESISGRPLNFIDLDLSTHGRDHLCTPTRESHCDGHSEVDSRRCSWGDSATSTQYA